MGIKSLVVTTMLLSMLAACGEGSDQSGDSSSTGNQPDDDRAADVLSEVQSDVDFQLYAPFELGGLEPVSPVVSGSDSAPFVNLALTAQEPEGQRMYFTQSQDGFGEVAPPPGIEEERQVTIQGNDAELQIGSENDRPMVLLIWEMDGMHFSLSAVEVEEDTVLEIAELTRPIDD